MMAWYLNENLDTDRLIRYALVHDLAEAYAGDVHALDTEGREGKAEREAMALERISAEFPGVHELVDTVRAYEAQADSEAQFVYALDKLMPILMISIEGGKTWRREGMTWERLNQNKADKVGVSAPIRELYSQLGEILEQRPELFSVPL